MSTHRIEPLEVCHREMFGDMLLTRQSPGSAEAAPARIIRSVSYPVGLRGSSTGWGLKQSIHDNEKRRASALVDELLIDIYYNIHNSTTDYNSATSGKSHKSAWVEVVNLTEKDVAELTSILNCLRNHTERMNSVLVRQLKRRDALRRQQEAYCDVITKQLAKRTQEGTEMHFTIQPVPGESGFSQWAAAMKMVAQLPGGIPPEFRRRLWLTLAEKHLATRGVNWPSVERTCFSEWSHPADSELGVQIVKDLHRTGCSLFCGEGGQENQALLKRVLLAYARWNKAVGYCQGFNMLAALILQVTDKCESDALKLMIYLIEGVLPDSYFADSLRGLSVDMAVFRELLRSKLPKLSKHLDTLQNAAKDGNQSYEPPLTNVFTMQWFLTLFCNCLPQPTVLRVWDLILLEGNEILLRTALAIWQVLAERILSARSADEFYCIMGVLTRELLEFNLVDGNSLIKAVVAIGPLTELKTLRDHYLYNINPWGPSLPKAAVEKQLKIYPKQSMALDISTLKKQYVKLKQRQRQAHIIFSAAISRQPPPAAPVTMNHLLLGKSALVPTKRIGPPKGSIPPARQTPSTLYWKDAPKQASSSSSSDTELCDDESDDSSSEEKPARESQFEDNPPPPDGDNILMNNDCAVSSAISEPEPVELGSILSGVDTGTDTVVNKNVLTETSEISDSFDTAPINVKVSSESDDENFDFEQFLADRVKCLKERSPIEEEPDQRINYARRNSERALQIIQENSLILHRILQCQTRLTPSPPLIHSTDATDENTVTPTSYLDSSLYSKNVEMEQSETCVGPNQDGSQLNPEIDTQESFGSEPTDLKFEANVIVVDDLQSPQYGSRYTSILEKSKSLDERYNALILNIPPLKQSISEKNDIKKTCDKTFDNGDNRSTDAKFNIFHKSEADYISLSDVSLSKDNHNDSGDVFDSKNTVHDLYKFDHIADNDRGISYSESYFLDSSSKVDIFSDVSAKKSQQEPSSGHSYLPTLSYFHSEKESEESIVTSPNANAFLKRDDFSRNEEGERNTFFLNSNFVLTAAQSDSAISCLDSLTLSTNIPLSESPESSSEELNGFKSTDLALPSSSIGDGSDVPSKSDILRETSLSTDYDENYKSHETCLSRSGLDACYNYSGSSPETQISKPTPWNNVCSKGLNETAEEISPARIQSDILETPAEMNTLSVFSKGSDDVRYFEEPAKRCLTLQVGGSSNSKSPLKSPLRSPNKAFNPFPVPLSSRQSKEVPIKLGLYKK